MSPFRYHQQSVIQFLRELADDIETSVSQGHAEPEVAVVVHGGLGEKVYVDASGVSGTFEAMGMLHLGQSITTNVVLGREGNGNER